MKQLLIYALILAGSGACKSNPIRELSLVEADSGKYKNPVFEPILADPTVIKASDGWFYAYGTMDNWGDGKGPRKVPIVKSRNLVQWQYVGEAFTQKPSWKEGGIWAPEVVGVNGKYHLYYAFSTWGDKDPGVGLAISDKPEGPFTDLGKLFLSSEVNVPNSIDPYYIENEGRKYIFWGSYSDSDTQGTYGTELSEDGKSIKDISKKTKIAAGDFEAVMIHKRNGYYYFFGSKENCCDAEKSRYQVRVGRSERLFGPYMDKTGQPLTTRGTGTILIHRSDEIAGPGHNSRIMTDDNGDDWILYHAMFVNNAKVPTGANRRMLMIDKVTWKNDWPEIKNDVPNMNIQNAPVFK